MVFLLNIDILISFNQSIMSIQRPIIIMSILRLRPAVHQIPTQINRMRPIWNVWCAEIKVAASTTDSILVKDASLFSKEVFAEIYLISVEEPKTAPSTSIIEINASIVD
jgi:hypothetical protein